MASLTTAEYADLHGVSTSTVRRWINESLIYAEKIGGRYSIPSDEPPPPFESEFSERTAPVVDDFGSADLDVAVPDRPLILPEDFSGDGTEEEEEEEFFDDENCEDHTLKDPKDLRKRYINREQAEDYAEDIPVPTRVFKRCADGLFQVEVTY